MMAKLLIGLLGAAVIATGGYAAATGVDDDPARTVSLPSATDPTTGTTGTTGATTTDEAGDISGPCDEAEHRNDPRCAGVDMPAQPATTTVGTTANATRDISGPCDEAEHRNDPRCTDGAVDDDDNSGPGGGRDDDDHGDGEDRSGPNRGTG